MQNIVSSCDKESSSGSVSSLDTDLKGQFAQSYKTSFHIPEVSSHAESLGFISPGF